MSVKDAFDYVDLEEYQKNEQYLDWGFAEEDVLPGLHNSEYFDDSDDDSEDDEEQVALQNMNAVPADNIELMNAIPVNDVNDVPVKDIPI